MNDVFSRLGGLTGDLGVTDRFSGIPFGLSLRKAAHSGLMGVSGVFGRVDAFDERVVGVAESVASVVVSGVVSMWCAGGSMMRH